LSIDQVTALLDEKRVLGPKTDILEVQNAINAYALLDSIEPLKKHDLLKVHATLMNSLIEKPG